MTTDTLTIDGLTYRHAQKFHDGRNVWRVTDEDGGTALFVVREGIDSVGALERHVDALRDGEPTMRAKIQAEAEREQRARERATREAPAMAEAIAEDKRRFGWSAD